MKKFVTILFALIVCIGMAFAAPEGYTEFISQEAIESGNSDFNHNVTWNSTNSSAVFTGNNCYLKIDNPLTNAGIGTGFSIRFNVLISPDNNSTGTYKRINGDNANKNGWQRLMEFSDGSIKNLIYINAGSSNHLQTYFQDNGKASSSFTKSAEAFANGKNYYSDSVWHVVELVVAPGGYGTLYVDETPVSWYLPSDTDDPGVNTIKRLSTFDTCLIGTSMFEYQGSNCDGFFFGEMKSIGTAPKAMRPLYNGTNYFYTIGFESNGGTAFDGVAGTVIPTTLPQPTKDGYFFEGWYTDSALTTKAVSGNTISDNTILYAKWGSHQHKWAYSSEGTKLIGYCTESKYNSQCKYPGLDNAVSLRLATNSAFLTAEISPENATDKDVIWSSSDTSVAKVDPYTGLITALKAGTTDVIAKSLDGSNTVSSVCTVTVR